jgi:NAD(P)-dependent dehydrogenase (short-subunit alcohol dehydrogenase family)
MHLAYEEAWEHGVTINAIAPGPVEHFDNFKQAIAFCNHEQEWIDRENVSPQDIAESVAFLCSEAASYISGSVVPFMFHQKKIEKRGMGRID